MSGANNLHVPQEPVRYRQLRDGRGAGAGDARAGAGARAAAAARRHGGAAHGLGRRARRCSRTL